MLMLQYVGIYFYCISMAGLKDIAKLVAKLIKLHMMKRQLHHVIKVVR